ncbi:hypothetical protein GWI33_019385 [Rhynchophorus ferrugineus]|uniref:Aspartate aminotransferase n=1 Tax=Rhynchophorus ferrugineus TaxID=354439 RepID=A0A834HRI4_RHYFE|nr:hypothetical protein GWI33_019385 [Rhynchophorus ferrugineus]
MSFICPISDFTTVTSLFADISSATPSKKYLLEKEFEEDDCPEKINLFTTAYKDDDMSCVFPVVRTAEKALAYDRSLPKNALNPLGYEIFDQASVKLILGSTNAARIENRTIGIQTLSLTGSLRIGGEFLTRILGKKTYYTSQQSPTSFNAIFEQAGFKYEKHYRYVDSTNLTLDVDGFLHDLGAAHEGSVVILQPSAHHPTGFDLSNCHWQSVADIIIKRKLFPFFFCCFQGFASGDLEEDVWPLHYFTERNIEFFCAQSLSKTFNLPNERVGCLVVVLNCTKKINIIKMHFINIIENMYDTPPNHGARVVTFILGNQSLFEEFKQNIQEEVERLRTLRAYLREELERRGAPGTWNHITNQNGIFCYTGLNDVHVEYIKNHYHVYLGPYGVINVSCLTLDNIMYIAAAMYVTLQNIPRYQ